MEAIAQWLAGSRDFEKGKELYAQYGDGSIDFLLKMRQTGFVEAKLLAALKALVPGESQTVATPDPKPTQKKEEFPPVVLQLIRERGVIHLQLEHADTNQDRLAIAMRIKAITRSLDAYFNDGVMPVINAEPVALDLPENAWKLHEVYNNNRSYISKNGKKADKKQLVQQREIQNEQITQRLKSMNYVA